MFDQIAVRCKSYLLRFFIGGYLISLQLFSRYLTDTWSDTVTFYIVERDMAHVTNNTD